MFNKPPAMLLLDNGKIFRGFSFGLIGKTIGEVCFNTGMTGYQEILTDPSYSNQLITMTYPHIGNYGINFDDVESSKIHASGFIVRDGYCPPSNYRATDSLENYLQNNDIVGIQGIDTRALVRCIRDEGAMNGIISSNILDEKKLQQLLKAHPPMEGTDLAKKVTCSEPYIVNQNKDYQKIVVVDYGIKKNILNLLSKEKMELIVLPAQSTIEQIMNHNPKGVFLSNGPGDPAAVSYAIKTVRDLLDINMPIFGICLGHQILALALGAKTYKLKFGHRGCNHPVNYIHSKKIEITSQNHGFSVDENSMPDNVIVTHYSLNDKTVEGIKCIDKPAFSVQYHPESSPGPHDSRYLFNEFQQLIKANSYAKTK